MMDTVSLNIRYYCTDNGEPPGAGPFDCPVGMTYCCIWDAANRTLIVRILQLEFYNQLDCYSHIAGCGGFRSGWFWTKLSQAVYAHASNACWADAPPCDDPSSVVYEFQRARCFKWKNVRKRVFNEDVWVEELRSCDVSNLCYRKWKTCWDLSVSPPRRVFQFLERGIYGTPHCPTQAPTLPPEGKEWDEPWETGCFQFNPCP